MKVTLVSAGTRGDTQPTVVLGRELVRRGHDVLVAASPNTLDLVARGGLRGVPVGPDTQAFMATGRSKRALATGRQKEFGREMLAEVVSSWDATVSQVLEATVGADIVVATPLVADATSVAADAHRVRFLGLHLNPVLPNRVHAHPLVTARHLPGPLAWAAGVAFERGWWHTVAPHVERSRAGLGLPRAGRPLNRRTPDHPVALLAWDPVLSRGLDGSRRSPMVGHLAPDAELGQLLEPPRDGAYGEVANWLAAGPPPVFFGVGSMPVVDPAAFLATVVAAARAHRVRALVSAGWTELGTTDLGATDLGDDVLVVGSLDHGRVLPQCAAVVHHGGAGTVQAGLAAGAPTVVTPVLSDQFLWGEQVRRLGVGATVPFARLDEESLTTALGVALHADARERARRLAGAMVPTAVAVGRAADLVGLAGSNHRRTPRA